MNIALIEKSEGEADLILSVAQQAHHRCGWFSSRKSLLARVKDESFDLVILGRGVWATDGMDTLHWIQGTLGPSTMVMYVVDQLSEEEIVAGVLAGADDYVTTPIKRAELFPRLLVLSRRVRFRYAHVSQVAPHVIELGRYRFDTANRIAQIDGRDIVLSQKEFDIAVLLFRNAGRLISRDMIEKHVWGRIISASSRTLDCHLSNLRNKLQLKAGGDIHLSVVYSNGYRLDVMSTITTQTEVECDVAG